MQLKNVYEQIDALAPFELSKEYCDTYKFYDNSGVILDCGGDVKGVLCSLDLSLRAVEEAKKAWGTNENLQGYIETPTVENLLAAGVEIQEVKAADEEN